MADTITCLLLRGEPCRSLGKLLLGLRERLGVRSVHAPADGLAHQLADSQLSAVARSAHALADDGPSRGTGREAEVREPHDYPLAFRARYASVSQAREQYFRGRLLVAGTGPPQTSQ